MFGVNTGGSGYNAAFNRKAKGKAGPKRNKLVDCGMYGGQMIYVDVWTEHGDEPGKVKQVHTWARESGVKPGDDGAEAVKIVTAWLVSERAKARVS